MKNKQLKYDIAYLKMAEEWSKLSHCKRKQRDQAGKYSGEILALKNVEFYNADHGVWADHPPMNNR